MSDQEEVIIESTDDVESTGIAGVIARNKVMLALIIVLLLIVFSCIIFKERTIS